MACGSSEGTIYLFNWDGFGATSDRFALRAESVDCMVPITESIVCMGSLDGVIRLGAWDGEGAGQDPLGARAGGAPQARAAAGRWACGGLGLCLPAASSVALPSPGR